MAEDNNVMNTADTKTDVQGPDIVAEQPTLQGEISVADNISQSGPINPNMPPVQLVKDGDEPLTLKGATFVQDGTAETNVAALLHNANDQTTPITQEKVPTIQGTRRGSIQSRQSARLSNPENILLNMFSNVRAKIEEQNFEITQLKDKLEEQELRFPQTADVRNDINSLRKAIGQSVSKLNTYYKEIRHIQDKDPTRQWPELTFATSWEEDNESPTFDYQVIASKVERLEVPPGKAEQEGNFFIFSASSSEASLCLSKHRTRPANRSICRTSGTTEVECERNRLQEELANRDKVVERLHKKVLRMQRELARLCKEQQNRLDSNNLNEDCNDYCQNSGAAEDECEVFDIVNERFEKLKKELLKTRSAERSCDAEEESQANDTDIQKKYRELLAEYTRKDNQLQRMQARVDAFTHGAEQQSNNTPLDILRKQLAESQEDHEAQKIIICEQAQQIEDYHEKYLFALQKNEEMKCIAKRLQMDNRKVEDQINMEIKHIKEKFENKLSEYAQYPNLLENEQIKLSQCSNSKRELEKKLRIVCQEYKKLKDQTELIGTSGPISCNNCVKLQTELEKSIKQVEVLKQCYGDINKRFDSIKLELDTMRKESAKVITRLKERSAEQRKKLGDHIQKLEKNLAKARAAVSVCCADKETTIKDMQGQLNCLSLCLDTSQKQIKTLKDHISYLNNGKTKSVVICCQADE